MSTTERIAMVTRADWVPGPKQGQWTYEDYAALPDDGNRYEIIDGVLYSLPSQVVPDFDVQVEKFFM